MESLVTFIIPLYNKESYVIDTLKSVQAQTVKDFKVIIVDDRSTDNSYNVVRDYIKDDKRFNLYQLDKNSGSAVARNYALDKVDTKYVSFLDADDLIDPNYLESQLNFIKDHGPIIVSSYRRKTSTTISNFIVPEVTDYESLLKGNPLACLTTMYDYSIFSKERFPIDMLRHEDYVFWLNILKGGYKAYGNKEVLATYNLLEGSKNNNKLKLIKPMYKVYKDKMKFNFFKSWYYTFKYCLYSKKKYQECK